MIKKSFLGLIGVLLICAILFTAFTPSFASSTALSTGTEIRPSLKETDRNSYYSSVAANLKDSFPKVLIQDEFGQREEVAYPQEYAGAYIDESNTLHIILTKYADMTTKNNYQAIMGNDDDIVYDIADFPLSSLYEIQRTLGGVMPEFRIECISINEITNKLEISLFDSAKEKVTIDFLKAKFNDFDVRCIIFKGPIGFRTSEADTTSNALAGSNFSTWSNSGTLGFNAYRHATGQSGVVTAAHLATPATNCVNSMGTLIGTASVRKFAGTMDAAFIPFNPATITYSHKMHAFSSPDDRITHYYTYTNYSVGTTVDKHGRASGTNSGTILALSETCWDEASQTQFTDQVKISNTQQGGDSGGPVFHTVVNGGTDFHVLVGIATFMDGSGNGYVSKVANIMSEFGITPFFGE